MCVYFSVRVWDCACERVLSCEHCAFIIFNVIPESQWKAANEAHWVSGLQYSTPAVYWLPQPILHSLSIACSTRVHGENNRDAPKMRA